MAEPEQQDSILGRRSDTDSHRYITAEILDLRLKALRSDLRLMIIASVALNQFLSNVSLPTAVTVPAIGVAIVAPGVKSILGVFFR